VRIKSNDIKMIIMIVMMVSHLMHPAVIVELITVWYRYEN